MRIGLFTDTYRPSINGIVFVVESLKRELESLGHEVFIICPAKSIRPSKYADDLECNGHVIRLPSIKGAFFDDYDTSIFFPPKIQNKIKKLNFDIIHVLTPSQIGLAGVKAAKKYQIPLVMQHSTDIYEFVEHYPAVLPGVLALAGIIFPMSVKLGVREMIEIIKLHRPRLGVTRWNKQIIERVVTILYSKADAVIALSRKSAKQLNGWQDEEYHYHVDILPNGVNALPKPTKKELTSFRKLWQIDETDEVFGFVGRLGEEKNLTILIEAFDKFIASARPSSKLLFVGDFEFREVLEEMAKQSKYGERIVFTGSMPRDSLGVAYAAIDVFCFTSLKDTQGWVLHEAAHAKKPIVLIDREVSEVVSDGENGIFIENDPRELAEAVIKLLADPQLREQYGAVSKKLASKFTEKTQVKKLEKLYLRTIDEQSAD